MLDHQIDELCVTELAFGQAQLAIDGLSWAQEFPWGDFQLADQFRQLFLSKRFDVVIDLFERYATLPEQPIHVAALRSSGLLVNDDWVSHESPIKAAKGLLPSPNAKSPSRRDAKKACQFDI